jgi:hypothetical protein
MPSFCDLPGFAIARREHPKSFDGEDGKIAESACLMCLQRRIRTFSAASGRVSSLLDGGVASPSSIGPPTDSVSGLASRLAAVLRRSSARSAAAVLESSQMFLPLFGLN